jgi:two-component system, LuxR family, sensor kinase FixL
MDRHVADSVMAPPPAPAAVAYGSRLPTLVAALSFLICYIVLDWASLIFPYSRIGITPWNPSVGLAWAFIPLFGRRFLPLLFLAPLLADVLVYGLALPWWVRLAAAALSGAGYAAALSILLAPKARFDAALGRMRDMVLLMGAAIVATGVVALAYVGLLVASGELGASEAQWALLRYWIGDLIGIAVVTPFLLVYTAAGKPPRLSLETAAQALAILLALILIFGLVGGAHLRLFYVLFVPIVWMGLRKGLEGATLGLVLAQIGVVVGLLLTQEKAASVTSLQALMLVLALTGLAIGVVVSERRRAERQLLLNQEAVSRISRLGSMGEIATSIAHEINQPLTAISNYTNLVKRYMETGAGSREAAIEAAGKAVAQVERTAAIIKSLRDLIRLGRSEIAPQTVQRIVRETVELLEPNLPRSKVEIKTRIPKDLPPVLADILQVEQVLLNLLWNAIEAIEGTGRGANGVITIEAALREPGFVEVGVADTGPGFPHDFKISSVGPSRSTKRDGLGLGLALSRSIVEAHGGRLSIGSADSGAVVRFTLRTAQEVRP